MPVRNITVVIVKEKTVGKDTVLVKYADDTTLVYPDQTEVSFADELSNIKEWSKQKKTNNKHIKNKGNSVPQISRPRSSARRLTGCRLPRTVISSSLSVKDHVDYILMVYVKCIVKPL